ncbi:MAG: teichoic acid transport system permease protein [Thermoleophilaceae bacterium]|jgi:ABC-type polysaccharide/polyol phosphate export permease|nr:teichoic acid transport system permease protein [Thermoleophilaceae bacterium]
MSTDTEHGTEQPDAAASVVADPSAQPTPAEQRATEFNPQVHVYLPHVVGLPPLRPYVREVWKRREFAKELTWTNLRSAHFNTAFGQLWLVLNPIMLSLVYLLLVDILRAGRHPPGYFAHLTAGIFVYYFVSGSIRESTRSIVGGGKLILNTAFPRVLLPLSTVATAFVRFIPTMAIYMIIHAASGLPWTLTMLWVVPLTIAFTLVAAGVCMFVAALQVYFRDFKNFMPYLLRIWLYSSPVLWVASQLPSGYDWVLYANPLGSLLAAWSDVLTSGKAPAPTDLLVGFGWGVSLFLVGGLFFMSRERDFAVRL